MLGAVAALLRVLPELPLRAQEGQAMSGDHMVTYILLLALCVTGLLSALFLEREVSGLTAAMAVLEQRVERIERAPARHQSTGEGEAIRWTR
jgi:hypothetical protein